MVLDIFRVYAVFRDFRCGLVPTPLTVGDTTGRVELIEEKFAAYDQFLAKPRRAISGNYKDYWPTF